MPERALLFVCRTNATLGPMAEGIARAQALRDLAVASAGAEPQPLDPLAVEVMREQDIDISDHAPVRLDQLAGRRFPMVVVLGKGADPAVSPFFGVAATLQWPIDDPADVRGSPEIRKSAFVKAAATLRREIEALFAHGLFDALLRHERLTEDILNSLSEGVLAHDLSRKIMYFSRGAERLTGLSQAEVLGRDCHEVFQPRLCGGDCAFQEGYNRDRVAPRRYSSVLLDKNGSRREFDVSLIVMRGPDGAPSGVVASLSDQTRLRALEHRLEETTSFRGIIGQDHRMLAVYDLIRDLAQCDFPVVITGESGTGKELVAQAIHHESPRRDRLFVPINCGALPEGTLESELFGHVKGAFTGAIRDKKGRFELADEGTLFLDEVTELSPAMQVKLLRVLQEGTFEPVGGEKTVRVNVRTISATNKDIKALVKSGAFREDLYYRLAVVPIEMPPLRQRRNDIPLLAGHFLQVTLERLQRGACRFSDETMSVLMSYAWPGNVRQLQNAIQFSLIKCRDQLIKPEHLPPEVAVAPGMSTSAPQPREPGKAGRLPKLNPQAVSMAMQRTAGNKAKAARILGVGRATLYNFLAEHPELESAGSVD